MGNKMTDNTHNDLLVNLSRLHTTEMGVERIKRNLSLDVEDVVEWCRDRIADSDAAVSRRGKNWYAVIGNCKITVNANSYTIITAHKVKSN